MDLEIVAESMGVRVEYIAPARGWGEYDPLSHTIRLHPRLRGIQLRAVLSHELGHAAHRHTSSTTRAEREADHFAHWLTIPLCGLLRATQCHDTAQGIAHELGVLPSEVTAYLGRLRR